MYTEGWRKLIQHIEFQIIVHNVKYIENVSNNK